MDCHVSVSRESHPGRAARSVAQAIRVALGEVPPNLAFLFFSPHFVEEAHALLSTVHEELSPRVLLGCMGDGVIGGTEELEGTPAVVLWAGHLPGTRLLPLRLAPFERDGVISVHGWPEELMNGPCRPWFILFADPFSTPMSEVFGLIEDHCPGAQAIGGLASGGRDIGENRLLLDTEIYESGLVGVALWGNLAVRTVVSQGCQPIGERYVVTKAERNMIYELGGMPTLQRLQATLQGLGEKEGVRTAQALQIGVAMDEYRTAYERGDFLIRGLMGADQQSGGVAVTDIVQEGQTIQFHVRDVNAASEELNLLLAKEHLTLGQGAPKGGLLFSCNGRGRRFFSQAHHDVTVVRQRIGNIPIAGFFAAGEIGPVGGHNYLHGYTASLALFCAQSSVPEKG